MPQLPILSGKLIVKTFQRIGYSVARQRGSHIHLSHDGKPPVTIPNYSTVGRGLLRKILREAEISPEEFIDLL